MSMLAIWLVIATTFMAGLPLYLAASRNWWPWPLRLLGTLMVGTPVIWSLQIAAGVMPS